MRCVLTTLRTLAVLTAIILLCACGRAEAEPTATPPATGDATPTATAQAGSASQSDDTAMIQVTLEPTPAVGPAAANATIPSADAVTTAPVVVEETTDCVLESDLDLAGYAELESVMGCAVDAAHTEPVGFNEFGPGPEFDRFMLWISWESQIYALLPEGTWQVYEDTWTEEQPAFACNPLGGEPASPPLPRRGFGKVWCEHEELQEQMGTIEVEERLCQHTVTQEFEHGRLIACFEDATIRYYHLFSDGTWAAVLQP